MSGVFVAVVGASGVGKDSLIAYARQRLDPDRVGFVRRVVTRSADCGAEDHDSLDRAAFDAAERDGQFALAWDAHGLRYGLPIGLEEQLRAGKVVVANLSRAVIPLLLQRYPEAIVVLVTAGRDILERRLASRGRETPQSIEARLARRVGEQLPSSTVRIDNSGDLEMAGEQFMRLLEDAASVGASA